MKIKFAVTLLVVFLLSGCADARISRSVVNSGGGLGTEVIVHAADDGEEELASFTTKFSKYSKQRNNNIALAARSIDQTIVQPGETFSYNETLGPTTKQNGYQKARIFVAGKEEKGYGGGVCQVSSTLYNAALIAGLEITERHPHSRAVHYVEEGKDAATSYGSIDLKFINNKLHPIIIRSHVTEDEVIVSLEKA